MSLPIPITPAPKLPPSELCLRTGAWYGDRLLTVRLPPSWDVEVFTPQVGVPLTDAQIMQRLESPVGQPPIRQVCRGKARPVVIVDDLNRPTPASRVVPALLRQFADAGIAARDVGIVMAPGTHGAPRADALVKKVGEEAAGSCQLYIHDCHHDVVKVGRTSFGTPVLVNKRVLDSDFLVGIGGLYPNDTAGFGGGSKLALGVLGFRSIASLHYGHQSMGWGTPNGHSTFRRDLDEIAHMIGLRTTVSLLLNADRDVVKVGRTSFGTPVLLNKRVVDSDFLVGIGGLYPNDTAGFGGGSKLALGVLGFRSIASLHYGHQSMGWGTPNSHSTFRRDLDEIARLIGLRTTVSLLLNADRDVIDVVCGDPDAYYAELLNSAREAFRAPRPDAGAHVIISNAYPNDLSLTFVRMKGIAPLTRAPCGASRIAIASCAEGLGFHGLFPFMNAPRFHRQRMKVVRGSVLLSKPGLLAHKVRGRLAHPFGALRESTAAHPIWLYCPDPTHAASLPTAIPGMHVTSSWDEIVEAVRREQGGRTALRVLVYGCAALQWLA